MILLGTMTLVWELLVEMSECKCTSHSDIYPSPKNMAMAIPSCTESLSLTTVHSLEVPSAPPWKFSLPAVH